MGEVIWGVVGTVWFNEYELFEFYMDKQKEKYGIDGIVTGFSFLGTEKMARRYAIENHLLLLVCNSDKIANTITHLIVFDTPIKNGSVIRKAKQNDVSIKMIDLDFLFK